ncbi:MAG: hypothetical protein HC849_31795 [Oscillatoriales cyanobacterium RU_3_3]|nr:hypothetical protein [Oscillatoriales cyanobacterium RU_3_3]
MNTNNLDKPALPPKNYINFDVYSTGKMCITLARWVVAGLVRSSIIHTYCCEPAPTGLMSGRIC